MTDLRDRSNQGTDPSEDATRRHDEARIMPDASLRDSARSHSICSAVKSRYSPGWRTR